MAKCTVHGQITERRSGRPLGDLNVDVELVDWPRDGQWQKLGAAQADAQGRYAVAVDLPDGTHAHALPGHPAVFVRVHRDGAHLAVSDGVWLADCHESVNFGLPMSVNRRLPHSADNCCGLIPLAGTVAARVVSTARPSGYADAVAANPNARPLSRADIGQTAEMTQIDGRQRGEISEYPDRGGQRRRVKPVDAARSAWGDVAAHTGNRNGRAAVSDVDFSLAAIPPPQLLLTRGSFVSDGGRFQDSTNDPTTPWRARAPIARNGASRQLEGIQDQPDVYQPGPAQLQMSCSAARDAEAKTTADDRRQSGPKRIFIRAV